MQKYRINCINFSILLFIYLLIYNVQLPRNRGLSSDPKLVSDVLIE